MDMAGYSPAIFISGPGRSGGAGRGSIVAVKLYRRFATPLFWSTMAIVFAFAIMPAPQAPDFGGDKINHIAAFLTLALLGRSAYRARSNWRLGIGLSLYGVLIELVQMIPVLHRDASFLDWLADSAAIVVMLAICRAFEWRRSMRAAARP